MSYKLICMSFDGDYVTEGTFDTVREAWDRSNEMGSRWYFYPWSFVVSGKTVVSAPELLHRYEGKRLTTVVRHFAKTALMPEMQNADVDTFSFALAG